MVWGYDLFDADPEVSTLNTLTNVQNSLFIPDLGKYLNRRPTYTLTRRATGATQAGTIIEEPALEEAAEEFVAEENLTPHRTYTLTSMTSRLDDTHFAVLPHGERLEGWTAEDRAELNDHVRHLLHSRKEKFKRSMKGFGQYVRKRKFPTHDQGRNFADTLTSARTLRDSLRNFDHIIWSCLGVVLDW